MHPKLYGFVITLTVLSVIAGLLLVAAPANSAPDLSKALQRPTVDPGDGGGGSGGDGGTGGGAPSVPGDDSGSTDAKCGSLLGQVINWGYGGEGGVTTELKNGSWQLSTVSATDGNYGFGGLGVGIAKLQVVLAPEQTERFLPHIQDAGIYLNCDFPTIANIALYKGPRIVPPATIEMSSLHSVIAPGGGTEITLTIKNDLPNDITNVVVTDLMPRGLIALDVTSSVEAQHETIVNGPDGQLVVVYFDKMASGAEISIRITVIGAADLPGTFQVTNTATLFYRESVADQTSLELTVRGSGPAVAPEIVTPAVITATPPAPDLTAATATPELQPTAVITTTPTPAASPEPTDESGEEFVPPDGLPTTGDDFVPPGFLPITGEDAFAEGLIPDRLPNTGLGFILPLSGVILAILAGLTHYLRSGQTKE
jgi:uncharacterized repeat protein (TIGR01451 family)